MVATAGAGNGGQSRGSARADNNQPKSGGNCSRKAAEMAAAVSVAAIMVTVAMLATTRQPLQR